MKGYKVFSGSAHPTLAEEIVKELDTRIGEVKINKFADGEIGVQVKESVRGRDVFMIVLCIMAMVLVSGSVFAGSGYFYWDSNYGGTDKHKPYIVPSGTEKASLGSWNDKISSYKIDSGVQCVMTTNSKFGGDYKYITGNAEHMPNGWNDKVSSLKCMPGEDYFTTNKAHAATCYVYEHNHYAGNYIAIAVDQNKASLGSMNDKISSIRVGSGIKCNFYKNSNYDNLLFTMTGGQQKYRLSDIGYNDQISSIRCYTYQP